MTYSELIKWLESANPILVFLVSIMTIIGGGYAFYLWWSQVLFRPKLNLRLPPEYILSRADTRTRYDHRWGHVEVYNNSSTLINSCQAWTNRVVKIETNPFSKSKSLFPTKIPLIWSEAENKLFNEISAGQGAYLDLFKFRGDAMILSHDAEGHVKDVISEKGIFIFSLECVAKNAKSDKADFLLTFDANNKPPKIEILRKGQFR